MLQNGLGDVLANGVKTARRFVDLFTGSGAVAWHVAEQFSLPVLAFDLQTYSTVLAGAIIGRETKINWKAIWNLWYNRAQQRLRVNIRIPGSKIVSPSIVADFRAWAVEQRDLPITKAYGGHYFSPLQTVWIDALRAALPKHDPERTVSLAALIQAASQCVAAPGHTAQPFQPTPTASKFLQEAWERDIIARVALAISSLARRHAKRIGKAIVDDANEAAKLLRPCDLVFIDPPYSGVHYSRFYHVLETIAQGNCGEVTGTGRYPAAECRPRSRYSLKAESAKALEELLHIVASRRSTVILTFPDHDCSNGLSGESVREIASKYFYVKKRQVDSKFSTLGGTGNGQANEAGRTARQFTKELILLLKPR